MIIAMPCLYLINLEIFFDLKKNEYAYTQMPVEILSILQNASTPY